MAFNNGYPVTYPQLYQPFAQSYTPVQAPNQNLAPVQQNGIIWVQGEAGAKAYPVAPGNSVLLMDSEAECFYIKSTDSSGVPMPLRAFTYTEIVQSNEVKEPSIDTSQFVTRGELDELRHMIDELKPKTMSRKETKNEQTISRNTK